MKKEPERTRAVKREVMSDRTMYGWVCATVYVLECHYLEMSEAEWARRDLNCNPCKETFIPARTQVRVGEPGPGKMG